MHGKDRALEQLAWDDNSVSLSVRAQINLGYPVFLAQRLTQASQSGDCISPNSL
jgi:hypothetical protein